jgi:hypothetical protein
MLNTISPQFLQSLHPLQIAPTVKVPAAPRTCHRSIVVVSYNTWRSLRAWFPTQWIHNHTWLPCRSLSKNKQKPPPSSQRLPVQEGCGGSVAADKTPHRHSPLPICFLEKEFARAWLQCVRFVTDKWRGQLLVKGISVLLLLTLLLHPTDFMTILHTLLCPGMWSLVPFRRSIKIGSQLSTPSRML